MGDLDQLAYGREILPLPPNYRTSPEDENEILLTADEMFSDLDDQELSILEDYADVELFS